MPQAAQVDVDIAIEPCQWPAQALFGQVVLADRAARIAGQDFEQIEFGAGQVKVLAVPGGAALFGQHRQLASVCRTAGHCVRRHRAGPRQLSAHSLVAMYRGKRPRARLQGATPVHRRRQAHAASAAAAATNRLAARQGIAAEL